jgi:hypothetical protein
VGTMRGLLWIGVVAGAILGLLAGSAVFLFDTVGASVALRTREEYVEPLTLAPQACCEFVGWLEGGGGHFQPRQIPQAHEGCALII